MRLHQMRLLLLGEHQPPSKHNRQPNTVPAMSRIRASLHHFLLAVAFRRHCEEVVAMLPLAAVKIAALNKDGAAMSCDWLLRRRSKKK